jgi:HSP20 family protein
MENEINQVLSRFASPSVGEFPLMNVWEGTDETLVTCEMPGIDPGTIEISVAGKSFSLNGSRKPESVATDESYHRGERWYGQFSRAVELPYNVEAYKVKAEFRKGVLYVTLPRAEAEKPKKITITSE